MSQLYQFLTPIHWLEDIVISLSISTLQLRDIELPPLTCPEVPASLHVDTVSNTDAISHSAESGPSTIMNKSWNDRADRDLFFTILSVKAIGVISGAEWTTIGNHMRSMGYGFTNEGCR